MHNMGRSASDVDGDGDDTWLMADEASLAPAAHTVLQYYHYNYATLIGLTGSVIILQLKPFSARL